MPPRTEHQSEPQPRRTPKIPQKLNRICHQDKDKMQISTRGETEIEIITCSETF